MDLSVESINFGNVPESSPQLDIPMEDQSFLDNDISFYQSSNLNEVAPVERENVSRPQLVDILQHCLRNAEITKTLQELTNMVDKHLSSSSKLKNKDGSSSSKLLEKLRAEPDTVVALLYRLSKQREEMADKTVEMAPVQSFEGDDHDQESSETISITRIKREEFVEDSILEKAFWKMESCEPDPQKRIRLAGKLLFNHIFTENEKAECFASGRAGQKEFPFQKVQNLSRALCWLQKNPPVRTLAELNKATEEHLQPTQFYFFRLEILINYANIVRGQLKKQIHSNEERLNRELPPKKRNRT